MPKPEEAVHTFSDHGKTLSPLFVLYLDIESILKKETDEATKKTRKLEEHIPIAIGVNIVADRDIKKETLPCGYQQFTGLDCVEKACRYIDELSKDVYK